MRRLLITSAWIGAAALAAVLLLPWWLGPVLPAVGRALQVKFDGYERVGYSRFKLESFEIHRPSAVVHVDQVEAETPALWLWHWSTGRAGAVVAGGWRVDVPRRDGTASPDAGARGWLPLKSKLGRVADRLEFWLPRAEVGPGVARWPGNELTFGPASWSGRALRLTEVGFRRQRAAAKLVIGTDHEMQLTVTRAGDAETVELQTERAAVSGVIKGWGQTAELAAHFGQQGWMPQEGSLTAKAWKIPAARAKLGELYSVLQGDGAATWSGGQLRVGLQVIGVPLENSGAPPLAVVLRGQLNAAEFVAEVLEVQLPGFSAHLTEPVTIDRAGRLRSGTSRFTLAADLAQWPGAGLRGLVQGKGALSSGERGQIVVDFSLLGEAVAVAETLAPRIELRGRLDWPRLTVTKGQIVFAGGDELSVGGSWDFATKTLSAGTVRGVIAPDVVARWLPRNLGFAALAIDVRASGPWRGIVHDGQVHGTAIQVAGLKPFEAEANWRGHGDVLDSFALTAAAGRTKLSAAGSADLGHARIVALALTREDGAQLTLAQPAEIRWRPRLEITDVHLAGAGATVDGELRWSEAGQIDLTAQRFGSSWLRDILPLPATAWTVERLALAGKWEGGPANFTAESRVSVELGKTRMAQLSARAMGGPDGVQLESFRIAEGEAGIVEASGQFPVLLHPRKRPLVEWASDQRFAVDGTSAPNPEFWRKFAELTGCEIVNPEVTVHLGGSLARPRGELRLRAERVSVVAGRFPRIWPKIEQLDIHLAGDEKGVTLDRGSLSLEGQAVRAEGWLPLAAGRWREWRADPLGLLRAGDLRVEIPDADLAAVAAYFPSYLAPRGRLDIDLRFKANKTVNGFVRVTDATSRPLGPLGVLQELNGELRFDDRLVTLVGVTAKMGGQTVSLEGLAEWPSNGPPRFDLALAGKNLPLVRQTGLLVRGDLDLKLTSTANGRTALTGAVRLRDSLFLSDIRALVPTGQKGTLARPPYFAIEAEPLNRWRLDVNVEGRKFLRLRTPVFIGLASARFQLSGTLGAPLAVGEATVEEGSIRLPFANFGVQHGQVRLTSEQPEPQIFLSSTTRRYGYDVRMELTGPAMAPIITFSSSPPLGSEQVLLMVMAGQAPRDEIATTDRQRAARFGAFFGQSLLGALSGNAEGADRLTISSGENVSAQGRETYSIEYRLNDRWALTGEYDEFDEYYGGVKWRFYQKGGSRVDAPP